MVVATGVSWRISRMAEVTGCDGADDAVGDSVSDPIMFFSFVPICKQTRTSPSFAHTPTGSVYFHILIFSVRVRIGDWRETGTDIKVR